MPIRYFIDIDCRPREEVGGEGLLELVSSWERAQTVRAQFREKHGEGVSEERMRFRERRVILGQEPEVREVSVAEVRERCQPLEELAPHCAGCPASVKGEPFGCFGTITLPITAAGERWLVDRVAPSGTRCVELFIRACESHQYGQNPVLANWRKAGFLEAPEPARAQRDGHAITSDQVLTELLLVGNIMPVHALGVLIHLGALGTSDGRTEDDLLDMIESVDAEGSTENAPSIEFLLEPSPEDDYSIAELKGCLHALFVAFSLQAPLAIRL